MPNTWIRKINESNSRLHKEDVIRQALEAATLGAKDADAFLGLAWHAYNPYETFHIKKVPTTKNYTNKSNDIQDFINFLDRLKNRDVTGNAALSELERVSMNYDSDLWNEILRPTLLKDLRIGATVKTFNKIVKGTKYQIPVFECQLATDSAKHEKKLQGRKIIEPKLDGIRALALVDKHFVDKTKVVIYSRSGKVLENFGHIEEQLSECLKLWYSGTPWQDNRIDKFIFDGEIVSDNFQALMKQARRKSDIDTTKSVFNIFDVIPLAYFNKGKWSMTQEKRTYDWLGSLRNRVNANCQSLHIIDPFVVDLDTAEGHNQMHRYATDMVKMGYEGIMIKDVDAPYECKRSTSWLKWKPTITLDLTLVGMEEGTGRNKGRLGALVCEGVDDGKQICVSVGSGLSDENRDDFWARQNELKGYIVEVKADAITQNQDGTYSLRFPRFEGFRGFEPGEKI